MASEIGIKELRDGLSRHIEEVHETGRALIITDRGRPVAKLVPLDPWDERYARLVAEGAITPAAKPHGKLPPPAILLTSGPTMAEIVSELRD